ncbi:MAG: fluoride efflux transporter CrcB [Gammaproteobacteria bacterium]|nr:fluoride efflux transporter CrcB [Gammaproteobacteria bacterium]
MNNALAIAFGGAAGAVLRYWVAHLVNLVAGRHFPWGTLTVNVTGCLLMGAGYVLLLERPGAAPEWRAGLLVGLLGAFTTFSTFSFETLQLFDQGHWLRGVGNVLASVLLCLGATWAGMNLTRLLAPPIA